MLPARPITIRPLAAQDRAEWQPLWQAYLTFCKTTLPDTIYDRTFQRRTAGGEAEGEGKNMFGLYDQVGRRTPLIKYQRPL